MRFKNAPLTELVAEFRWVPNEATSGTGQIAGPLSMVNPAQYENLFATFSQKIATHGYVRTERLIPTGWPAPMQVPVFRFKPQNFEDKNSTLYQLGAGIFSVHALPPYKNWEEFKPVIHRGLSVLVDSGLQDKSASKFTTVVLRYIDQFKSEFVEERSARDFVEQVLGFRINLPVALQEEAADEHTINPTLQFQIPLKSGLLMTLGVNPPTQPPTSGIVLDTSVASQSSVAFNVHDAIETLETAHTSIHKVFIGITEPIHARMEVQQ